ncbi:MAG: cyclic peptide export ABC transporter [SAR324 cluster bacterium]|nr:cyclic peptide export ABC transporter [SAR324 cluster bacterium]
MELLRLLREHNPEKFRLLIGSSILTGGLMSWLFSFLAGSIAYYENQEISIRPNLFIIGWILWMVSYRFQQNQLLQMVHEILEKIRNGILDHLRKISLRDFEKIEKSQINNVLTYDMDVILDASHVLAYLLTDFVIFLGVLIFLAWISFKVALITALIMLVCIVVYYLHQTSIQTFIEKGREQERQLFNAIQHQIFGFKELRMNDAKNDDYYHLELCRELDQMRDVKIKVGTEFDKNYLFTLLFWNFLIIIVVYVLPTFGVITKEVMIAAVAIVLYIPLWRLMEAVPLVTTANLSVRKILELEDEIMDLRQESLTGTEAFVQEELTEIRFEEIQFEYLDAQKKHLFTLGPINLTFQPGNIYFITGGNGSGKSTLVKVITGLYTPGKGSVYRNTHLIPAGVQREWISAVFSDYHLFDRVYSDQPVNTDQMKELLSKMHLDHKTEFHEDKFSNYSLSSGQRRRLALILALIEEKPVYVFDEWAADQDPVFRDAFYHEFLPQLKARGKIVIVVSHDDHYYDLADQQIRMEEGKLVT